MTETAPSPAPRAPAVLTKALVRVAERLHLTASELGQVIGVSRPTASRMRAGQYVLRADGGKEFELAALLVRLYRSLIAIVGTDENARTWLRTENTELGDRPLALLRNVQGLIRVVQYLDAYRGRV